MTQAVLHAVAGESVPAETRNFTISKVTPLTDTWVGVLGLTNANLSSLEIRKLLDCALKDLPAMPEVVQRVVEETGREDPSIPKLESLISSDISLTAKTLRIANSAYYGLPRQVTSIGQALMVLGLRQVRNVVLSLAAVTLMEPRTPRQRELNHAFWVRSLSTASAANWLGYRMRLKPDESDIIFVGGMLCDIGRLFLATNLTETWLDCQVEAIEKGVCLGEVEERRLTITGCEMGATLAEIWQLPLRVEHVIRYHEAPLTTSLPEIKTVHFAKAAVNTHLGLAGLPVIQPEVENWLGLTEKDSENLKCVIAEKLEQASTLVSLIAA